MTTPHPIHSTEREQALRWLIANRRPEVSIEQAIKILRFSMRGDPLVQAVLDDIAAEKAH